jgi:hypothetical protein
LFNKTKRIEWRKSKLDWAEKLRIVDGLWVLQRRLSGWGNPSNGLLFVDSPLLAMSRLKTVV